MSTSRLTLRDCIARSAAAASTWAAALPVSPEEASTCATLADTSRVPRAASPALREISAVAAWLFVRQRKSTWWPFVWGFIFFALFAFFVELVPYLPSYGGYVRYLVGILLTVLSGRYAIRALQDYRARLALKEAQPDTVRREELHYDTALARLAKGVCPGCERPVDLKDAGIDFCPHCGIGLHDHCGACQTRKSAFAHFCQACGTAARGPVTTPAAPTTAPG